MAESAVIGATVGHMLRVWPQTALRIYVGCYCNDGATVGAVMAAAGGDPRLRVVITDRPGPTTKADCLNRLYNALMDDERRMGRNFQGVVLHDAEDMVHPRELALIGDALNDVDFVQLPVRPELTPGPHWVSGHYCDEFVESHARVMPVRDALGAALPAAGWAAAFPAPCWSGSATCAPIAARRDPLPPNALPRITRSACWSPIWGQGQVPENARRTGAIDRHAQLFSRYAGGAVRQKTRWIHGIALQSWDRMGWMGRPVDVWMALRDRRGPLVALVLGAAYALLLVEAVMMPLRGFGVIAGDIVPASAHRLAVICFAGLLWRMTLRFAFSAREYGVVEGLRAMARVPVANIITIMAGRRALVSYGRSLRGVSVVWDKTPHLDHPVLVAGETLSPERLPA
jgi:adsorption protein B